MTKTGPQKYPGASLAYFWQKQYGGDSMESNVIVWHSTEGTSLPSYGNGASAPNFTTVPDFTNKRMVWYQHFDFDTSSRALVNRAGGVDTNTLNVCQVEVVGTCDPAAHKRWTSKHLYMPELPSWAIRDLRAFAKWAQDNHGVPRKAPVTFKAYPSSYGANGVRMSNSAWLKFTGHCGHQHVPENDHGDPGLFPIAEILRDLDTVPTPPPLPPTESSTAMQYTQLSRTGNLSIPGGTGLPVYFDTESADEPNDHGSGGRTVLTGAHYTGTVWVWLPYAAAQNLIGVKMTHELADGSMSTHSTSHLIIDPEDATTRDVSVTGTVAADRKLYVEIFNYGTATVTIPRVDIRLLSQAL